MLVLEAAMERSSANLHRGKASYESVRRSKISGLLQTLRTDFAKRIASASRQRALNTMISVKLLSRIAAVLTTAFLLSSCGGFFPASNQIVSLSLSPASAYILPQGTQQFSATATFGNNTTGDVSSQVAWTSSATGIATVNSSGLVTTVALGTSTLTAKSNNSSVTATALITVSTKTITAITVTPSNPSISISAGQTQQFAASATFSDGTVGNVSAAWNSSSTSVATISSSGLASPVGPGQTTISASAGGVVGTTQLTVTQ